MLAPLANECILQCTMHDIPRTTPRLIVLETQPSFPDEDLTTPNAEIIAHSLVTTHDERAHAASFGDNLVPLFRLGHEALQLRDLPTEDSRASYETFRDGFATTEYAMTVVRPGAYNGARAVGQTRELMRSGVTAPIVLAEHYADWLDTHPHTFGVVADVSIARGDTIRHTQARAIGACIAAMLQRGSVFVP